MAARLAPDNVRRAHQSLHNVIADAPWSEEAVLAAVRSYALTAMRQKGPIQAWIVDDTGFPKKGRHSVGVARQYCGQVGKQENCRVAVSLSVSTNTASVPIAWRLYLPHEWADDGARRKQAGIPDKLQFASKAAMALEQIRVAVEQQVPPAPVLAYAAYGTDTQFREAITQLGLRYVLGIQSSTSLWKPGEAPLPKPERKATGRPPKLLRRDRKHQPVAAKQLALSLPASAWKTVTWRQGAKQSLRSRFAAVRVRPAHRDYWRAEPTFRIRIARFLLSRLSCCPFCCVLIL